MSNQIEIETAEDLDHHLEMGEALERLRANPDFQKLLKDLANF